MVNPYEMSVPVEEEEEKRKKSEYEMSVPLSAYEMSRALPGQDLEQTYVHRGKHGGVKKVETVTTKKQLLSPDLAVSTPTMTMGGVPLPKRRRLGKTKLRPGEVIEEGAAEVQRGVKTQHQDFITQRKLKRVKPTPGVRGSGGMRPSGELETVPTEFSPFDESFGDAAKAIGGAGISGLFSAGFMDNPFIGSGDLSPRANEEVSPLARHATEFAASLPLFKGAFWGLGKGVKYLGAEPVKALAKTAPGKWATGKVVKAAKSVSEPVMERITPLAKQVQLRFRRFIDRNPEGPNLAEYIQIRTGGRAASDAEKARLAAEAKALGYDIGGSTAADLDAGLLKNAANIDAGQKGLHTTLKDAESFSQFIMRRLSPARVGGGGEGYAVSEAELRKAGEEALKRGYVIPEATGEEVRYLLDTDLSLLSRGFKGVGRKEIVGPGGEMLPVRVPSTVRGYGTALARIFSDDTANITANMRALGSVPKDRMKNPVEVLKWSRAVNGKINEELNLEFGNILTPIKHMEKADKLAMDKFRRYVVARRGIEKQFQIGAKMAKKGKVPRGTEATGDTVAQMKETVRRLDNPTFQKQHEALVALAHKNLDRLVRGGMLTKEAAAAMKSAGKNYVPFYREEPKAFGVIDRFMEKVGSDRPTRPHRFFGSELEIMDPMVSTAKQTIGYARAAEDNIAKQALVNWAKANEKKGSTIFMKKISETPKNIKFKIGQIEEQLKELGGSAEAIDSEAILNIFTKIKHDLKSNQMIVWQGGTPEVWEFTRAGQAMQKAYSGLGMRTDSLVGAPFQMSARMLRMGATGLNPSFTYKNLLRDLQTRQIQSAAALGEDGVALTNMLDHVKTLLSEKDVATLMKVDIPNFTKSVAKQFGLDGAYQQFLKQGGGFSSMMAMDKKGFDVVMDKIAGTGGAKAFARKSIDGFRDVLAMSENISRFAEYQLQLPRYLKSGMTFKEASFNALRDSQEVTLNFMTSGTTGKILNRYIPFFNAHIRDLSKIGELMRTRPDVVTSRVMQQVTMPSIMLWNINKDNEAYKAIPDWEKDVYYHIPKEMFGFDDKVDPFVRFPRPFFWGYVGGRSVEEMLEIARGSDDPRVVENLKNTIGKAFIPPLTLPLMDLVMANTGEQGWKTFFERPVITRKEAGLPHQEQKDARTSASSIFVSELGRPNTVLTSPDAINKYERLYKSPKFLDNAIYTQFAGLSRHMLRVSDFAGKSLQRTGAFPKSRAFQKAFSPKDGESKSFLGFMEQTLQSIDDLTHFRKDPKKATLGLDFDLVNRFMALSDEGKRAREQLAELVKGDPDVYQEELNLPDTRRRLILDHTINGRLPVQSKLNAINRKIKTETGMDMRLSGDLARAMKDVPVLSQVVKDSILKWRMLRDRGDVETAREVATQINKSLIMYEIMIKKRLKEEEDKD